MPALRFVRRSYRSIATRIGRLWFNRIAGPAAQRRSALDRAALTALLGQPGALESLVVVPWHEVRPNGAAAIALTGLRSAGARRDGWPALRSALFAAGYVPLRAPLAGVGVPNVVYVRSDTLTDVSAAGAAYGDSVGIGHFAGRLANQLWQYLFVSMYGLCHGLVVEVPPWEGETYFGFRNRRPRRLPTLKFEEVQGSRPLFWGAHAPRNINLLGFFQEIPPAWQHHRRFVRRLLMPRTDWRLLIEGLVQQIRREGHTLVAIHVRRGDYRILGTQEPRFRIVPTNWYRDALAEMWPRLRSPLLHVATDEPAVVAEFSDFPQLGARLAGLSALPEHLRDFFLLSESDHLLACNSSFSLLAAVLAAESQCCRLVDFERSGFVPFDAWSEREFWSRFTATARPQGVTSGSRA